MRRSLPSALLLCAALLTACGGGSPAATPPAPAVPHGVSGNVDFSPITTQTTRPGATRPGATEPQAIDWSLPHVPGRLLVLQPSGLNALGVSATFTARRAPPGTDLETYAAQLRRAGYAVQPDYLYRPLGLLNPAPSNDPGVPGNAGFGGEHQDFLTRTDTQAAWSSLLNEGRSPTSAVVADLDTGVTLNHPDLSGRLLPGFNTCVALDASNACTGENTDPSELTGAEGGHGTATIGIIGADGNNNLDLAGLSWSGQTLLPIKVFGQNASGSTATSSSVARGIDVAVQRGARVINMSLGFIGSNDALIHAALTRATAAGVLSVASAGNTPGDGVYYPASDVNVISVGAVGDTDDLACYSARPTASQRPLDLVAPGGNAGSGTANCSVLSGHQILVLTPTGVGEGTGTSFSAPQVSGAAGLILGRYPALTLAQLQNVLVSSARTVSGGRLLDVNAALNAAAAVTSTPAPTPAPAPAPTPAPAPQHYHLVVTASQSGQTLATSDTSGTLQAGSTRVPYTIAGLPDGNVLLSASLDVNTTHFSGTRASTLTGADLTAQDISAH